MVSGKLFFLLSVLYCTLLGQAQTASEKKKIESIMEADAELADILKSLQATDQEDLVGEERTRKLQARQSRVAADIEAMDIDGQEVYFKASLDVNIEMLSLNFEVKLNIYRSQKIVLISSNIGMQNNNAVIYNLVNVNISGQRKSVDIK